MGKPFSGYRMEGWQVSILHQIGRACVARLTKRGEAPQFGVRYRNRQAAATDLAEAFALVRDSVSSQQKANRRLDSTPITQALLLSYGLSDSWVSRFYAGNRLDSAATYPYGELRKIVLANREYNCQHFSKGLKLAAAKIQESTSPV